MILSRGRRYLFIHIPKTGGTSMALALEARAMKDDLMLGDTPKAMQRRHRLKSVQSRGRLWKHATMADIDGLVGLDELPDLFCFTLVRNPWERTASYYHWLRSQSFEHNSVRLAKTLTFDAFVQHPKTLSSLKASPAAGYMTDASGQERCDLYIRLEHLAHDIAALEAHLGFSLQIPKVNASEKPARWQSLFSNESVDALSKVCANDIQRFGYRFE
ncbi:MAG: sulfotransferase family 2 domain-containing protein [Aliishimia sp.]